MAKGGDREKKCCRVFLTILREKYFFAYNIKKLECQQKLTIRFLYFLILTVKKSSHF